MYVHIYIYGLPMLWHSDDGVPMTALVLPQWCFWWLWCWDSACFWQWFVQWLYIWRSVVSECAASNSRKLGHTDELITCRLTVANYRQHGIFFVMVGVSAVIFSDRVNHLPSTSLPSHPLWCPTKCPIFNHSHVHCWRSLRALNHSSNKFYSLYT